MNERQVKIELTKTTKSRKAVGEMLHKLLLGARTWSLSWSDRRLVRPNRAQPGRVATAPDQGTRGPHDLIRLKIASNPWYPQSDR